LQTRIYRRTYIRLDRIESSDLHRWVDLRGSGAGTIYRDMGDAEASEVAGRHEDGRQQPLMHSFSKVSLRAWRD
jgi:hypothetical protein